MSTVIVDESGNTESVVIVGPVLTTGAFTDLTDTPLELGTPGQVPVVSLDGQGLEFVDSTVGGAVWGGIQGDILLQTDLQLQFSETLKDSDTISPVTPTNKVVTQVDAADAMLRSVYDTTINGIVDDAEKVNGLTVETAVPVGAVFTDTVYDDSDVLKDADANSPVTPTNKVATMAEIATAGVGDMTKAVYDTNNNGRVDNAERVNSLTVDTAVPPGALFTDTVYSHPTTPGNLHVPAGGTTDQILRYNGDGLATWGAEAVSTADLFLKANKTALALTNTNVSTNAGDIVDLENNKEDDLGLPAGNNYVLASDTLGNRVWFDASALGVTSVNGETGVVVIDTGDVSENGNLYFTNVRADARVQDAIQDTVSSASTMYSSAKVDSLIAGALNYKGSWDASTNTPVLTDASGVQGDYYKVSVAGSQDLGSGLLSFNEGDDVIHNGIKFEGFGTAAAVTSVNGKVGVVVLGSDDIAEGAVNLWYTDSRVDARLAGLIDDNTTVADHTWSSTKIDSAITNAIGAVTFPVISVAGKSGIVLLDKTDVGLDNVDNTTDLLKPISTATQDALNLKADQTALNSTNTNVSNNTTAIGNNTTAIGNNTTDIGTNAGNISTNSTAIGNNTTAIGNNTTAIGNNATAISNHTADVLNPHAVTKDQVGLGNVDNTDDLSKPVSNATQVIVDTKTQWFNTWAPGVFNKNSIVRDGDWLMIANKVTEDRPAPQPYGDPSYTISDSPAWSTLQEDAVVHSGQTYTFTKKGWISTVRVFVPTLSATTNYRFRLEDITDPAVPIVIDINDPVLVENKWVEIGFGKATVTEGSVIRVTADSLDSGTYTTVTGGWDYLGRGNNTYPTAGQWTTDQAQGVLRVAKVDLDAVDRTSELLGITPDSTVQFVQTSDTNRSVTYSILSAPTEVGDYISMVCVKVSTGTLGEPLVGETTTTTFDIPVAQHTQYVEEVNAWAVTPAFATVEGFVRLDGIDQTAKELNAYGIDIKFQEASVSLDWDYMSSASTASGSGEGGTTTEVIDNLLSTDPTAALSANQGRVLEGSKENDLGLPPADGYALVSDTGGNRSWSARTSPWGSLTGTLSNQIDLQSALDSKALSTHLHTGVYEPANINIQSHIIAVANPHNVTQSQVGLGNVDNSSDVNKPVSVAQQNALNAKEDVLGNPTVNGQALTSTTSGVRSWTTFENTDVAAIWGNVTGDMSNQSDITDALNLKFDKAGGEVTGDIKIISGSGAKLLIQSSVAGGQPQLHLSDNNNVPRGIFGADSATGDVGITRISAAGAVEGTLRLDTLGNVKLLAGPTEITPTPTADEHLVNKKYVDDYGDTLEPNLGLPAGNNYVLASDTAGNRSWFDAASIGVTSVNGATGVVTLATGDIAESSNLYFTTSRADARVQAAINDTTASATELYSSTKTESVVSSAISGITYPVASVNTKTGVVVLNTTDVGEGSNLYFTDARSDARVQAAINDTTASATELYSSTKTEAVVSNAVSAITFPVTSVNTKTGALVLSTTDVGEGSNLYYTDARADARAQVLLQDTVSASTSTYSSTKIDSLISGSLSYKGGWDAGANTPTISDGAGSNGDYYKVEVGGSQNLGSGAITFSVGDDVIHNGIVFERFGSASAITSVNGKVGVVVLDSGDIAENGNLYYTDSRVDARLSGVIDDNASSLTTVYSSTKIESLHGSIAFPVDSVNTKTGTVVLGTDDIAEGVSNLWYTAGRVDARLSNVIDDNSTVADHTWSSNKLSSEFSSISHPVASVNTKTGTIVLGSDDIAEGVSNLYYTNSRVDARLSGLIDDNSIVSDHTWSSTKIDTTIDNRIGAITPPVLSVNGKTGAVVINKVDVQLGNVDNTSDVNKPISTATGIALNGKSDTDHLHTGTYEAANSNIQSHIGSTANPHGTTMLGLTDTPSTYAGNEGQAVYVKQDGTGIEFTQPSGLTAEAKPSGLVTGGELNIASATQVEVIAGQGMLIDSYTNPAATPTIVQLSWNTTVQVIVDGTPSPGTLVYLMIGNAGTAGPIAGTNLGTIQQLTSQPSPSSVRDAVYLGYILFNGDTWGEVSAPVVVNNSAISLAEYIKTVSGPQFVQSGGATSEASTFSMSRDSGVVWELNRNWHVNKKDPHRESFNEDLNFSFRYANRDFTTVTSLGTVADASLYDSSGTVVAVPGNNSTATIQRVFIDQRDNYWVLYGQNVYTTFDEALSRLGIDDANTEIPQLLQSAILLGYVIAEKSQTSWTADKAHFLSVTEAAGGGSGAAPIETFLALTDTPSSYIANEMVIVNPTADGLATIPIPNIGVGKYVGSNITHDSNGSEGANITTGIENNVYGLTAGEFISTGDANIAIGTRALRGDNVNTVSGGFNIAIGHEAGLAITSGNNNVLIGKSAGSTLTNQSDRLVIASSGTELITGNFVTQNVAIAGELLVDNVVFPPLNVVAPSANISVNMNQGQYQKVTLTSNATLAVVSPSGPGTFYLHIHQDATGGRTLTMPTGKWVNGVVKNITTTANAHDILMIHYYGGASYVFEMMSNLS